jgi:hypothetical protein
MNENKSLDNAVELIKKASENSKPPQEIIDKTSAKINLLLSEQRLAPKSSGWSGLLKLAAAAAIILAAGFYAGRLTRPVKLDPQQLGTLQMTLKSTLESQIQQNLQAKFEKDFQSLLITNNTQLNDLAAAIDSAQKWERLLIAAALKQMETNRLNENNELRNELVTYASFTERKLAETEKTIAKLMAGNSPEKNSVNQIDNIK